MKDKIILNKKELEEVNEIIRLFKENENKAEVSKFDEPIQRLFVLFSTTEFPELKELLHPYFSNKKLFYFYWELITDFKNHVEGVKL